MLPGAVLTGRRGQACAAPCPLPSGRPRVGKRGFLNLLASTPLAGPHDPEKRPRSPSCSLAPCFYGSGTNHPRREPPDGFQDLHSLTCRDNPNTAGAAIFSRAAVGQTRAGRDARAHACVRVAAPPAGKCRLSASGRMRRDRDLPWAGSRSP